MSAPIINPFGRRHSRDYFAHCFRPAAAHYSADDRARARARASAINRGLNLDSARGRLAELIIAA